MIPILVGWGGSAKLLAYAGMWKCDNCKNFGHFQLYEIAKKANVFFVPVAKWGKKYYLVCSTCEASLELTNVEKDEVLQESLALPTPETATAIWDEICDGMSQVPTEGPGLEEAVGALVARHKQEYSETDVDYVRAKFMASVQDDEQPE